MRSATLRSAAGKQPASEPASYRSFAAIDFETADSGRDSACAVGVVRVEDGVIVRREHRLIRPPRRMFLFTHIHGITWEQVSGQPSFGEVWAELGPMTEGVPVLAAHNAPFDAGVLRACCEAAGVPLPAQPFLCTVKLARKTWGLYPTNLPAVCARLGIELDHHQALSDAEACAKIVIQASNFLAGHAYIR